MKNSCFLKSHNGIHFTPIHSQSHGQPPNWDPSYGPPANQHGSHGHQRSDESYMHQGQHPPVNQPVNHAVNQSEIDHSQQDIFPAMANIENHTGNTFDLTNNPEMNDLSNIFHIYEENEPKSDQEKSGPVVKTEL